MLCNAPRFPERKCSAAFYCIHRRSQELCGVAATFDDDDLKSAIEEWGKLLSDVPAASAILDRLLHHAEISPSMVVATDSNPRPNNPLQGTPLTRIKPNSE
jgi:hypothetical protein